jgi:uncharacterized protein (TIGR02996 family)
VAAVGHELLRAVLAAPDDDAPRLVYADWLSERGDPRGEFIQTQCVLAANATAPRHEELRTRERELLATHGNRWLHALGLGGAGVAAESTVMEPRDLALVRRQIVLFKRGFVDAAKLNFSTYEASSAALAEEPLRHLALGRAQIGDAARLSELRAPPSLRTLAFRGSPVGSAGAAALASCRALRDIGELRLIDCDIDHEGLSALASSDVLGALQVFDFSKNRPHGRIGAEALSKAPWLSGLRSLLLNDTGFGDDGLWVLARSRGFRALRELGMKSCRLQNAGICALASSHSLRTLTHIDLGWNSIGDEAGRALIVTRMLPHLERLDVSHCTVSPASMAGLRKRYGERLVT